MVCEICGQNRARLRKIARTYGKGKQLLVIENVPVVTCPDCGESYLEAETLHTIDRIKQQRRQVTHARPVAVANYA